jgi:hypothetical protein
LGYDRPIKIALQVILSAGAIASFLIIAHYFFLAINKPERLLRFLANLEKTATGKIYYGFLFIGWITAAYFGAKGLLFWVPTSIGNVDEYGDFQPLKDTIAIPLAFLSLPLIGSMEELARSKVRSRSLDDENVELKSILTEVSGLRYKLSRYEELQKSSDNPDQELFYARLQDLGEHLDKQINTVVENALNEDKRRREEQLEREALQAATSERQAEFARQLQDYRNALEVAAHRKQLETIRSLEHVSEGVEYLIDATIAVRKWHALERTADSFLSLNEKNIKNGEKVPSSINGLIGTYVGTSVIPPLTVMATYSGDSHGGHTELYVEIDGRKESYLKALKLENSLEALVEGLFIAFELPKKGAYWHGLYGRDYSFLFDNNQLIEVLRNKLKIPPNGNDISKVDRPCGIRISKSEHMLSVSCLAAYPNGTIVNMSAHIDGGRLVVEPEDTILKSNSVVFY